MDLATITDLTQLKAMAYDQMVVLEQTQNNLRLVNQRISALQTIEDAKTATPGDEMMLG